MKVVIGIDPDAKKHGVAIYIDGKLTDLLMNDLMDLMDTIKKHQEWIGFDSSSNSSIAIHMENVCANNAVFRGGHSVQVQQSLARRLGMCQQSQVEIERLAESMGVPVVKHKISKKWKSPRQGKAEFERLTGWTGRSNEDSRSAAFFGFIGSR